MELSSVSRHSAGALISVGLLTEVNLKSLKLTSIIFGQAIITTDRFAYEQSIF